MFICGVALIFMNFLRVIYAPDPNYVYKHDADLSNAAMAAQTLAEIGPNEALPLVLFVEPVHRRDEEGTITSTRMLLHLPITLLYAAVTLDGRMVKATKFVTSINDQMFFCPRQNSAETCLVPTEFDDSDQLQCNREPIPMTYGDPTQNPCGKMNTDTLYTILYEICPNPDAYETTQIQFYEFCYDTERRKTIYTSHIILSPYLLSSKLLYREQRVKYPIKVRGDFKPLTLTSIKVRKIEDFDSIKNVKRPAYRLQFLVPDGDMAMGLWRKTTHQNFNLEWQHQDLIPLWDEINNRIRSYAEEQFRQNYGVRVRTAVVNFVQENVDKFYKCNVWVKIISLGRRGSVDFGGLAIFMNNFILSNAAAEDTTAPLNEIDVAVGKLCPGSCTSDLQHEFYNVGGRVRCCSVTNDILYKIGIANTNFSWALLSIPGINYNQQ